MDDNLKSPNVSPMVSPGPPIVINMRHGLQMLGTGYSEYLPIHLLVSAWIGSSRDKYSCQVTELGPKH